MLDKVPNKMFPIFHLTTTNNKSAVKVLSYIMTLLMSDHNYQGMP